MTNRVIVVAEHTPDPDTLRLDPGRSLGAEIALEFGSAQEATGVSPLAARLLALAGVRHVRIEPSVVVVTKHAETGWESLGACVVQQLQEHLEAGEPCVLGAADRFLPISGSGGRSDPESEPDV